MQTSIKAPDGKLFPTTSNTLKADSFNGMPYSWRWSVGLTTVNQDQTTSYTEYRAGNDGLTADQWAKWTTQPDADYILGIASTNLGLTLA